MFLQIQKRVTKMETLYLIMPEKREQITVKFVGLPYVMGEKNKDVYCDVKIFGNKKKDIFRLKLGKTLWLSLYSELVKRYELGGDFEDSEIGGNLEILSGKIITIYGIPDLSRSFKKKGGEYDSPKIFRVSLREDLMEAERKSDNEYLRIVDNEIKDQLNCMIRNLEIADDFERKMIKREEEMRKRQEKAENDEKQKKANIGW